MFGNYSECGDVNRMVKMAMGGGGLLGAIQWMTMVMMTKG